MRVLIAHNLYQQSGGEDQSFKAEVAALRGAGHQVSDYQVHNDSIKGMSSLGVAARTVWNRRAANELRELIKRHRPQVVHFNNTFPLISPAAFYAAKAEGVAVIQSLRNYRLMCPNALFFRDGKVCEDCMGKFIPWPGVMHACYRGSRSASATVAGMITVHRALRTWKRKVDLFIALTEFARQKFIQGGLPAERIVVKPNFVHPDPGPGSGDGGYAVFLGRLTVEKGVRAMLQAWRTLGERLALKIIGDGPLSEEVAEAARTIPGVEYLGRKPPAEAYDIVGGATLLVLPSEWYETFGRVAVEAFAKGTPVIAADLGAMAELIDPGRTGLLFQPGNAEDLVRQVRSLLGDAGALLRMRHEVRREFEAKYTAGRNVQLMLEIYEQAIELSRQRVSLESPAAV